MIKLTTNSFFQYFILRPNSSSLIPKDRIKAKVLSASLGIFTVGITHLVSRLFLFKKNFTKLSNKAITNKAVGIINPSKKSETRIHSQSNSQQPKSATINPQAEENKKAASSDPSQNTSQQTKSPTIAPKSEEKTSEPLRADTPSPASASEKRLNEIAQQLDQWCMEPVDPKEQRKLTKEVILWAIRFKETKLDLFGYNLSTLPECLFTELPQLKKLNLGGNRLASLPDSFDKLSQLQELSLRANDIITLPESICRLPQLTTLDLALPHIVSLPDNFGDLTELTTLDLEWSRLKAWPSSFGKLTKLQTLNLRMSSSIHWPESLDPFFSKLNINLKESWLVPRPPKTTTKIETQPQPPQKIEAPQQIEPTFGQRLDQWCKEWGRFDNRQGAKEKILECISQGGTKLDLKGLGLYSLPGFLFSELPQLQSLDLSGNWLKDLPGIDQLSQLTILNLRGNHLKTLPENFGQLSQLRELDLSSNLITVLPDSFGKLSLLTALDLSSNTLTSLPESFGKLSQLTTLNLQFNRDLTSLPNSLVNLLRLRNLNLEHSGVTVLPPGINNLRRLEHFKTLGTPFEQDLNRELESWYKTESYYHRDEQRTRIVDCIKHQKTTLDLSDTGIRSLPECLFTKLPQLTTLNLKGTNISTLPVNFSRFSNLVELNLRWSSLTSLPADFGDLPNLETLDLSLNINFTSLPDSFGKLKKLTNLSLHSTGIRNLPRSFGELPQLTTLDLSGNEQLTSLGSNFSKLPHLTKLDLSCNKHLTSLPDNFGELSKLTTLDLAGNYLRELPDSFGLLPQLQKLDLSQSHLLLDWINDEGDYYDRLSEFYNQLSQLRQLKELSLRGNRLTYVPDFGRQLSQLTTLDLSRNQFTTIPPLFAHLPAACAIDLQQNPYSLQEMLSAIENAQEGPRIFLSVNRAVPQDKTEKTFEQWLQFWQELAQDSLPLLDSLKSMYPSKINELRFFLSQLPEVKDYKNDHTRPRLAKRTVNILKGMTENQEFGNAALKIMRDYTETCGDQVALGLNTIECEWKVLCQSTQISEGDLVKLAIGWERLGLLEEIALNKVLTLTRVDVVEVILVYQVKLAKELNLPVEAEDMLYENLSQVSQADLEGAKTSVIQATSSQEAIEAILLKFAPWKRHLDEAHRLAVNNILEQAHAKQDALDDAKSAMQDNDYNTSSKDIAKWREQELHKLYQRQTAKWLQSNYKTLMTK